MPQLSHFVIAKWSHVYVVTGKVHVATGKVHIPTGKVYVATGKVHALKLLTLICLLVLYHRLLKQVKVFFSMAGLFLTI